MWHQHKFDFFFPKGEWRVCLSIWMGLSSANGDGKGGRENIPGWRHSLYKRHVLWGENGEAEVSMLNAFKIHNIPTLRENILLSRTQVGRCQEKQGMLVQGSNGAIGTRGCKVRVYCILWKKHNVDFKGLTPERQKFPPFQVLWSVFPSKFMLKS